MASETWLIKVKNTISHSFDSVLVPQPLKKQLLGKKSGVGILSFEIAVLMSKILHIWESISDKNIVRFRSEAIHLEGVRKIVSNDDVFLLSLACAEMVENLRLVAKSVSRISQKCEDTSLRCFGRSFDEFACSGRDPYNWVIASKEMEAKKKKLDRLATTTATLHREMEELVALENGLKKSMQSKTHRDATVRDQKIVDLQEKILWQRQEVKYLKEKSLWSKSFDTVTSLLARPIFTILARIKLVFGVDHGYYNVHGHGHTSSLHRSLSTSALVHPFENPNSCSIEFVSGPLRKNPTNTNHQDAGFLEQNFKILKPPPTTLGWAALALHYANVVTVVEKMIKSPKLIGNDARNDLYSMLPSSIRSGLRDRLKGVGCSASDPVLASDWRDALHKVLKWLSPLAHNMIKWQSERSFEQQNNLAVKANVLLLQTLFFANRQKTEAAITELLVGLNYIWRFEKEMDAKAMFQCSNFE